jgi:CheY-like chemotaxis protein
MPGTTPTILLVQPDAQAAERYAAWLRADGYRVIDCPGPRPPHYACYMLETARCPLAEAADLLIYDAWMPCDEGELDATELVRALRARYPAKSVLLVAPRGVMPPGLIAPALHDPDLCLLSCPDRQSFLRTVAGLTTARRAAEPAGGRRDPPAQPAVASRAASVA